MKKSLIALMIAAAVASVPMFAAGQNPTDSTTTKKSKPKKAKKPSKKSKKSDGATTSK
jgi:hypothetical protein